MNTREVRLLFSITLNGLGRDYSTHPVEIKYSACENLQTPNTNRMLEQSCSHDILSLIYHSVQ